MIQKLNNSFKIMVGLDIILICAGIVGFFYIKPLIMISILGLFNFFIMSKKRSAFIENYNTYKCSEEEDTVIPDKFVRFLYYGKKHLYNVGIFMCDIIPYDGLEIKKITATFINLENKSSYTVNKNHYKKMKLDISQVEIGDFKEHLLNNIEEAKNMDINDPELKRSIKERENKQKTLSPVKIFSVLIFDVIIVLIPAIILLNYNESIAVLVLLITVAIATIVTIPVTISYLKQLFRYKKDVKESGGSIAQFYRVYFRLALLPIVMILFFWFIAVAMTADIWFDTWLF